MKYLWLMLILIIVSCQQQDKQINQLQKRVDSLQTLVDKSYKPGFGELMNLVHHHFDEMYRAGQIANWQYTEFEIHEMREAFDNISIYQSQRKETAQLKMIFPALEKMKQILKKTNVTDFNKAYINILNTCNACHKQTGYDFIKIIKPE